MNFYLEKQQSYDAYFGKYANSEKLAEFCDDREFFTCQLVVHISITHLKIAINMEVG